MQTLGMPDIYENFNSTMVRLKELNWERYETKGFLFQFHYGTIKSVNEVVNTNLVSGFQFHYGTIKRKPTQGRTMRPTYFNSTMVRLKDRYGTGTAHRGEFQFHYGTIKRKKETLLHKTEGYFNSTMVRLKVRLVEIPERRLGNFNSTMVRLKDTPGLDG